MRAAVLISGEYRTFPVCRPTMTFLNDPSVDVYFSTWNISHIKSERLGIDERVHVTQGMIENVVNRPVTTIISDVTAIKEKKYNTKMLLRWIAGIDAIKESGKSYDHITVVRPDLFFWDLNPATILDLPDTGKLHIAWYNPRWVHNNGRAKLQDCLFTCSAESMLSMLTRELHDDWLICNDGDWHSRWADYTEMAGLSPAAYRNPFHITFCRNSQVTDANSAVHHSILWRDASICDGTLLRGIDLHYDAWNREIVDGALRRFGMEHLIVPESPAPPDQP